MNRFKTLNSCTNNMLACLHVSLTLVFRPLRVILVETEVQCVEISHWGIAMSGDICAVNYAGSNHFF